MYWKPPPSNWCDLLYFYIWLYCSGVELSLQGLRGRPVGLGACSYGTCTTDISTRGTCTYGPTPYAPTPAEPTCVYPHPLEPDGCVSTRNDMRACVLSHSLVCNSATPRTVAHRLLCPWGFSRQEYWSGLPCPPPGDLPEPCLLRLLPWQDASCPRAPAGKPRVTGSHPQTDF